jgi:hypothetical protein
MVIRQPIKLGPGHARKLVTVVIRGHTHRRILHGEEELVIKPYRDITPIMRLYVHGMTAQPS